MASQVWFQIDYLLSGTRPLFRRSHVSDVVTASAENLQKNIYQTNGSELPQTDTNLHLMSHSTDFILQNVWRHEAKKLKLTWAGGAGYIKAGTPCSQFVHQDRKACVCFLTSQSSWGVSQNRDAADNRKFLLCEHLDRNNNSFDFTTVLTNHTSTFSTY